MREIKFRAWDTVTKQMHQQVQAGIDRGIWFSFGDILDDERINVMQFTGVTIRGKECYEGDIIKCGKNIAVVEWEGIHLKPFDYISGIDYVHGVRPNYTNEGTEIIGNIHETPELLTP